MFKSLVLAAGLLIVGAAPSEVQAQQSLQALHTRVPAPPATAAVAPTWLTSLEVTTLRQQLEDQRAFVDKLHKDASASSMAGAGAGGGGIDFARAQRDPAYAKELQARIAKMSQEEQMQLGMQMAQATQAQALQDVKAMAADSDAVKLAADHYPDYQTKQMTGRGITAQYTTVGNIQQRVSTRAMEISAKAEKAMKCSDGEGSCTAADQAADKATLRAAHAQIVGEYDKALAEIAQQVAAARKLRALDIAAAQKDLGAAQYGAAAKSNANKQLLATYHNTVLIEIEQLFILSEDTAKWAATRYKDRTINFMPID